MADSAPSMEEVEERRVAWVDARRRVINRLREIADILDAWFKADHTTTVAGSGVGIVGGGMMLGGLLFPPLVIPGLLMTLAGAGGKIGTSIAHMNTIKSLSAEAQRLCEEDASRLTAFVEGAEKHMAARAAFGATAAAMNALKASTRFLRHTFITVPNAAGKASLKALLPAAAVGPIRFLAGATAGIGIAFDLVSMLSSFGTLARNESDALAVKIREVANKLEQELNEAMSPKPKDD